MKDKIFIIWSGENKIALKVKKILEEKYEIIIKHFNLLLEEKGEYTATREIRKHISWYVKGLPNATVIRDKINSVETEKDFKEILKAYFNL